MRDAPPSGSRPDRIRARRRGLRAETAAALWLTAKGYRIVARGWRTPRGEIDLIARRGQVLAFVEVKARVNLADAADAIGSRKRRRTEAAAREFLACHPSYAGWDVRFDAVLIRPWRPPIHMANAWMTAGG